MRTIKSLRVLSWKFLKCLPDFVAEQWIRSKVYVDAEELKRFAFKVANTREEFEQGFKLLYECYVAQGYQKAQPDFPLRITKYHLMPTSTMFIVKDKATGKVVATLTHIIDSAIGLPVEKAIDLSEIRKKHIRVAEISALAIEKGYRRNSSIMFALTRIVYHFSVQYTGCDCWVICVSNYVDLYYRSLFFFKRIKSKKFKYEFVNDTEACSMSVDLNELPTLFKYFYNHPDDSKNLHHFYLQDWEKIFQDFPESIIRGASTPTLSVELVKHFFQDKTSIWAKLTEQEKFEIINAYYDENLLGSDESLVNYATFDRRSSARRLTNIRAEIVRPFGIFLESISSLIVNVSEKGFLLKVASNLDLQTEYKILIQATSNLKLSISFTTLRSNQDNYYSCLVHPNDLEIWKNYFRKIEEFCLSLKEFKNPVGP